MYILTTAFDSDIMTIMLDESLLVKVASRALVDADAICCK